MNKKFSLLFVLILVLVLATVLVACNNKKGGEDGPSIPDYVKPTIGATYGQTLADLQLPTGFSWQDPLTTSVGDVGQREFLVTFTPEDTEKYQIVRDIPVTVTVAKGTPQHSSIASLNATYGQTLADVALPTGFSWQDPVTSLVGNVGNNLFHVRFTPTDSANYNLVENIPVTIAVAKANYDMSGVSFTDATFTYDGQAHSLSLTGTIPTGLTVEYLNNGKVDAGTYEVTAQFSCDNNHNVPENLTANIIINKATLSGISLASQTFTYDGQAHSLSLTGVIPGDITPQFTNNGKVDAGTYPVSVHFTPSNSNNYNPIDDLEATLTINKAEAFLNSTGSIREYTYDGEKHQITNLTQVSGEVSFFDVDGNPCDGYINAGDYPITVSVAESNNYLAGTFTVYLLINKANYDMSGVSFADKTVTYNGTTENILISGSLPTGVEVEYEHNTLKNAGSIIATAIFTGDETNYNAIENMTATLTISKIVAEIVWDETSFTYNGIPQIICGAVSNKIAGDYVAIVVNNTDNTINVGEYTLTDLYIDGSEKDNYVLSEQESVTITVTRAPLTIRADNIEVTYGDAIPEYTVSYTGFVAGENSSVLSGELSIVGTYEVGSNFGNYSITPSGFTSNNYEITFNAGNLHVNKAPLTITAENKVITYGDDAPAYSVTYTGFVLGQNSANLSGALDFDCNYSAGDNAGTYDITPKGYTSGNYAISFINGFLTVNKASANLTLVAENKVYDGDPYEPVINKNGNGELTIMYKEQDAEDNTYTTTAPSAKGYYTIQVSVSETTNYLGDTITENFRITSTLQTIVITSDISKDYDGHAVDAPTYTGKQSTGSTTIEYKVLDAADNTYTTTAPVNAGSYTVRVSIEGDENYEPATATQNFTINKVNPSYTAPTGLESMYSKTLSTVELPEGWTWDEDGDTVVGNAGNQSHSATFVPDDTTNYNNITIDLTIAVAKARFDAPTYISVYAASSTFLLKDIPLPEGWAWDSSYMNLVVATLSSFADTDSYKDINNGFTKIKCVGDDNHESQSDVNVTIHLIRVTPTLTYSGTLDTPYGNSWGNTVISYPRYPTENWGVSMGMTPNTPGVYASNMEIDIGAGNLSLKVAYKVKGANDSTYDWLTSTTYLDIGDYTCKIWTEKTSYLFAAEPIYIDFSVTKGNPTVDFDQDEITTEINYSNSPYATLSYSSKTGYPSVINRTYEYKVLGSDDSTYTTDKPTIPGDYVERGTLQGNNLYNSVSRTCTLHLTKASREIEFYYDEYTLIFGSDIDYYPTADYAGSSAPGTIETVEYKPYGADDSAYTTTIPTAAGSYVCRVSVSETDSYLSGTVTAVVNITYGSPEYIYYDSTNNKTYVLTECDSDIYLVIFTGEYTYSQINDSLIADGLVEAYDYSDGLFSTEYGYFEIVDEDTHAMAPYSLGTFNYITYVLDENMNAESPDDDPFVVLTMAFYTKNDEKLVYMFDGELTQQELSSNNLLWIFGEWEEENNIISMQFEATTVFYEKEAPNSTSVKIVLGEIKHIEHYNYDLDMNITITYNIYDGSYYSLQYYGEYTEQQLSNALPMMYVSNWYYEADGKLIATNSDRGCQYIYYVDDNNVWQEIDTRKEIVCYYAYYYDYVEVGEDQYAWKTITLLYVVDLGTHDQIVRKYVQDGVVSPYTYFEILGLEHFDAEGTWTWNYERGCFAYNDITLPNFYYDYGPILAMYPFDESEWYAGNVNGISTLAVKVGDDTYVYNLGKTPLPSIDNWVLRIANLLPEEDIGWVVENNQFIMVHAVYGPSEMSMDIDGHRLYIDYGNIVFFEVIGNETIDEEDDYTHVILEKNGEYNYMVLVGIYTTDNVDFSDPISYGDINVVDDIYLYIINDYWFGVYKMAGQAAITLEGEAQYYVTNGDLIVFYTYGNSGDSVNLAFYKDCRDMSTIHDLSDADILEPTWCCGIWEIINNTLYLYTYEEDGINVDILTKKIDSDTEYEYADDSYYIVSQYIENEGTYFIIINEDETSIGLIEDEQLTTNQVATRNNTTSLTTTDIRDVCTADWYSRADTSDEREDGKDTIIIFMHYNSFNCAFSCYVDDYLLIGSLSNTDSITGLWYFALWEEDYENDQIIIHLYGEALECDILDGATKEVEYQNLMM